MRQILPIRKRTVADALVEGLKEFIETGGFERGERLPSFAELARMFEVGVPSVRMALNQLQAVGVVDVRHGSGVYVKDHPQGVFLIDPLADREMPTRADLMDIVEACLLVEPAAAALAAVNATAPQLDAIKAELQAADEQIDLPYADRLHAYHFHQKIGEATGNRVVHSLAILLSRLYRKECGLILEAIRTPVEDNRQHREIFDAVRKRQPDLARDRMTAHLTEVKDAYEHNSDVNRVMKQQGIG